MNLEEKKNCFYDCCLNITCNNEKSFQIMGHRHKLANLLFLERLFLMSDPDEIINQKPQFIVVYNLTIPFEIELVQLIFNNEYEQNEKIELLSLCNYFQMPEIEIIKIIKALINKFESNEEFLFLLLSKVSELNPSFKNDFFARYYGILNTKLQEKLNYTPEKYFNPSLLGVHKDSIFVSGINVEYEDLVFSTKTTSAWIDGEITTGIWLYCNVKDEPQKIDWSERSKYNKQSREVTIRLVVYDCFTPCEISHLNNRNKKIIPSPFEYQSYAHMDCCRGRYGDVFYKDFFDAAYCFEIQFK